VRIDLVTLVVGDYDEAIDFYVGKLGFELAEDAALGSKRWVVVRPPGGQTGLLLARAAGERQTVRVGDQVGGRVGFFLKVDDFAAAHARLNEAGVRFLEAPRQEAYGAVAVFEDLYGNRWDLLGPPA
jgi:catechol 2,3-dioxygenase-like lactoylglutathione lyase family enzyme